MRCSGALVLWSSSRGSCSPENHACPRLPAQSSMYHRIRTLADGTTSQGTPAQLAGSDDRFRPGPQPPVRSRRRPTGARRCRLVPRWFQGLTARPGGSAVVVLRWRKRKGIEPSEPSLARGSIGFEDRGRHQSGTRFHRGAYTEAEGVGQARARQPPNDFRSAEKLASSVTNGGRFMVATHEMSRPVLVPCSRNAVVIAERHSG